MKSTSPITDYVWRVLTLVALHSGVAAVSGAEPRDTNLLPNGGFEFWVRPVAFKDGAPVRLPEVPLRWAIQRSGSITLQKSESVHGGQSALAIGGKPAAVELSMRYLEVYPGARYRFGVWAKGSGAVTVKVRGVVLEGLQVLAEAGGAAGPEWTHVGGDFTVPRHVLGRIQFEISAEPGVTLDDAHVSAPLEHPFDADAVLRDKPARDARTLLFEDFDGDTTRCHLAGNPEAGVTPEGGGRFGKGLRLLKPASGVLALPLEKMPAEGTLECWMTLDDNAKATFLSFLHPASPNGLIEIKGANALLVSVTPTGRGKSVQNLAVPADVFYEQAMAGQWAHVAVTWNRDTVRCYVNGVLADLKPGGLAWPLTPSTLQIGNAIGKLCWNGVLDEVRVSDVCRYGPPVPAGFMPFPPVAAAALSSAPEQDPGAAESGSKRYDPAALANARKRMAPEAFPPSQPGRFESSPDEAGRYVYEAEALHPLVEGANLDFRYALESRVVLAALSPIRAGEAYFFKDNQGGFWTVGTIPEGDYHVGLLCSFGHPVTSPALYLNGRVVQLTGETDARLLTSRSGRKLTPEDKHAMGDKADMPLAPDGLMLRELRSSAPVHVKPGDEFAVMSATPLQVARLLIYPKAPAPGRHFAAPHYDPHTRSPDTALAVNGQLLFRDTQGKLLPRLGPRDGGRNQAADSADSLQKAPDGRPAILCEISNPLPTPVEVEYVVAIRSYYRIPVGGERGSVRVEPHTKFEKLVPFDALEDERAFSAELSLKVVAPSNEAAWRKQMGWPELDWIRFFPGMRQGLPWPAPFEDYELRRIEFGQPVQDIRKSILLDGGMGTWEYTYSPYWNAVWPTEENLNWCDGMMPFKDGEKDRKRAKVADPGKVHALYIRRRFSLTDEEAARCSIQVFVSDVAHAADVYVNGVKVGQVRGGNTPILADATAAVHPGENELMIVSRDALAITNPAYINRESPTPGTQYLEAPGHYSARAMSIGGMATRCVELRMAPRVAADRLQIIPSTRSRTLTARWVMVNNRSARVKAIVRATVLEAGKPVFKLGEQALDMPPGAALPVELSRPWPDVRCWWPADPHLYVMAVETFDSQTGERLDRLRERFGFRESRVDGPHMMLNETPIKPNGYWLGYRQRPNHMARGTEGSGGPDYCDESGMMGGSYITQLSNTGTRHNLESDAFWKTAQENALKSVMRYINNPSVIRWDMSNEWLIYCDGGDPLLGARRFKTLSDAVRLFDPTRWTTFGAEGDVHGVMDHYDFHYANPYFQNITGSERMRGHNAYFPDGEFWREPEKDFVAGEGIRLNPHKRDVILYPDRKMMFEREYLWKSGTLMPPGTVMVAGENALLWPAWDAASGASLWMWKQKVDGHRDLGVSAICGYTHPGLKRRAYAHQTFIMPQVEHHGFAGRTLTRRYAVLQDLINKTCDMTFRWTLKGPDGKRLDGGEARQRMGSGATHRGELRVKLPEVQARTLCVLALELESDGATVMAEERDLDVWPDVPVKAGLSARKVLLLEPESGAELQVQSARVQSARVQSARVQSAREQSAEMNVVGATSDARLPRRSNAKPGHSTTAAALSAAGVAFERITHFDAPILTTPHTDTRLPLLIIAEDALNEENRSSVAALSGFVARGGRVLILRQTVAPVGLPVPLELDREHWASQCFVRAGNHPLVEGFGDWDFHFWADDRSVVRGAYVKPEGGAFVTILDSSEARRNGVLAEFAGLMEHDAGDGLYVLCQLPLVAKFDQEPMAREMLARLIGYAAGEGRFQDPAAALTLVADPVGPVVRRFEALGARFDLSEADVELDAASRILMVANAVRAVAGEREESWRKALESGAVIAVADATPEDSGWLSILAGRPVRVNVPPYPAWDGRGMRNAWTPLTAGLGQFDLYWKRFDGAQEAGGQAVDPKYVIESFQDYSVKVEGDGVVESVWPGALLEINCGQGRLILDQRNLYTSHEALTGRAARNISALLLGMGCRIQPPAPLRDMPKQVKLRPVDLSKLANLSLADETAGDGTGGWTDEGAAADMRAWPAESRRIGNVPFEFSAGAHQAVALSHAGAAAGMALPSGVDIPIGAHLEGLHFLHTVTDLPPNARSGVYRIQYDDGSDYTITLEDAVNIVDWSRPGPMKGRRGTKAAVAWTGTTATYPLVGVCRLEWVNPWPERRVASVVFELPPKHQGMPVLLAMTAAVPMADPTAPQGVDAAGMKPSAESADKARQAARAASAALTKGDDSLAARLAGDALKLDPACDEAHGVLADIREKTGTEDQRLAFHRGWIAAGARIPRPYNAVGTILETRGELKGALDAYNKSLEIEWNQPPIIEAKSRVEHKLK